VPVAALTLVKAAIVQLTTDRATLGANIARLTYTGDQLGVLNDNLTAANSRITDVTWRRKHAVRPLQHPGPGRHLDAGPGEPESPVHAEAPAVSGRRRFCRHKYPGGAKATRVAFLGVRAGPFTAARQLGGGQIQPEPILPNALDHRRYCPVARLAGFGTRPAPPA